MSECMIMAGSVCVDNQIRAYNFDCTYVYLVMLLDRDMFYLKISDQN